MFTDPITPLTLTERDEFKALLTQMDTDEGLAPPRPPGSTNYELRTRQADPPSNTTTSSAASPSKTKTGVSPSSPRSTTQATGTSNEQRPTTTRRHLL